MATLLLAVTAYLSRGGIRRYKQHSGEMSATKEIESLGGLVSFHSGGVRQLWFRHAPQRRISTSDLAVIQEFRSIRYIDLSSVPINDDVLKHMHGLTDLEHLRIPPSGVSRDSVEELRKHVPGVRVVPECLWNAEQLPDVDFLLQRGILRVAWHTFHYDSEQEDDLYPIVTLGGARVTDDAIQALLPFLSQVRSLRVRDTNLTDEGAELLLTSRNLRSLWMYDNSKITSEKDWELRQRLRERSQ